MTELDRSERTRYDLGLLFTDWRNMAEFGAGFLRPDLSDWDAYAWQMLETVQIAVWGTALAVVFGVPFAILWQGRRNTMLDTLFKICDAATRRLLEGESPSLSLLK